MDLSDGESYAVQYVSTLERTVLSPPLTPLKYTLFSHDGVRLRDVCSTSDTTLDYTTPDK